MEPTDKHWEPREVVRILTLLEGERRYFQDMMTALPVSLVVANHQGKILSVNRTFRKMFDLPEEDLPDNSVDQLLSSEQLREQIISVCSSGVPLPACTIEVSGRPMRATLTPVKNSNHGSGTEALLMLEEQSEAAPMSGGIAKDVPAVIWEADAETLAFRTVSGNVESVLGYPISHWLATPQFFSGRIHADDRDEALSFYQSAIQQGLEASAEFRAVSASGHAVWCRESIRVTEPKVGTKIVTGVLTNIDARKRMEVQSLTAERISVFHDLASRLAHELNDPVMIAAGFAEELLHTFGPHHSARADVEQILEATRRISDLTKQLSGSTRGPVRPLRTMELTGALSQMKKEIEAVAGHGVTVEFTPAGRTVWTQVDPSQMGDVILALASGAREDALGRTRLMIGCTVEAVAEHVASGTLKPGLYARLTVHSNGRGFDPAKQIGIFDMPLTDREPGAGALAHAYALVRQWDGDIVLSGERGSGSTYSVYLPYRDPASPALSRNIEEKRLETSAPTILVAEIETGVRELIRKILGREGYETLGAASASEALGLASTHEGRIDLLLANCVFPDMSGPELARRLRELSPGLVVTYLSAQTDAMGGGDHGPDPGDRILEKPFSLDELVTTVRDAWGDARRQAKALAKGPQAKPMVNGKVAVV